MFYYISGELVLVDTNIAVVDACGVGYKMAISGNTLGNLAGKIGSNVKLYTYLSVREDAMELYGFYSLEELSVFKLLISVSGVGTKSAVSILSLMTPEKFAAAVMTGDTKAISKAQGIGAKTSARIILELKDKIKKEFPSDDRLSYTSDVADYGNESNISEAINGLLVLGYSRSETLYALKGADPSDSIENLIKGALSKLMK